MTSPHLADTNVYDSSPDFCYAVSLIAAMEGAVGMEGHDEALPLLGIARAELVDLGQRRPAHLLHVDVVDIPSGLQELHDLLTAALAQSEVLQHSLRLDAARRHIRRLL